MPSKAKGEIKQTITVEIFNHLVDLAAFELSPEEGEYLRKELNEQLRSIRELESIDVSEEIPITSHGVPYSAAIMPSLREDIIESCPEADAIVEQAPEVEERYIVVPDIPSEALE
ncbi:MAG: aspartyl/glutamyl-tRNA amidotransferase subunit C [Anaerolineales bacterium]|nr:aspartyl/glutamyl-tRNA amidotransferase subunit C [Anaerolineales bacterium]